MTIFRMVLILALNFQNERYVTCTIGPLLERPQHPLQVVRCHPEGKAIISYHIIVQLHKPTQFYFYNYYGTILIIFSLSQLRCHQNEFICKVSKSIQLYLDKNNFCSLIWMILSSLRHATKCKVVFYIDDMHVVEAALHNTWTSIAAFVSHRWSF